MNGSGGSGTSGEAIKVALLDKIVCLDALKILLNGLPTISTPKNQMELYTEASKLVEAYFHLTPSREICHEFSDLISTVFKAFSADDQIQLFLDGENQFYFIF